MTSKTVLKNVIIIIMATSVLNMRLVNLGAISYTVRTKILRLNQWSFCSFLFYSSRKNDG